MENAKHNFLSPQSTHIYSTVTQLAASHSNKSNVIWHITLGREEEENWCNFTFKTDWHVEIKIYRLRGGCVEFADMLIEFLSTCEIMWSWIQGRDMTISRLMTNRNFNNTNRLNRFNEPLMRQLSTLEIREIITKSVDSRSIHSKSVRQFSHEEMHLFTLENAAWKCRAHVTTKNSRARCNDGKSRSVNTKKNFQVWNQTKLFCN